MTVKPWFTDEVHEAASRAILEYQTAGCCTLDKRCGLCDCDRPIPDDQTRALAAHVLAAIGPMIVDGVIPAESPETKTAQAIIEALMEAGIRVTPPFLNEEVDPARRIATMLATGNRHIADFLYYAVCVPSSVSHATLDGIVARVLEGAK